MIDTERHTLMEEVINSTPINDFSNYTSPLGFDENEIIDWPNNDEARYISQGCNTYISFPPNIRVDCLADVNNEDYDDISVVSEEFEANAANHMMTLPRNHVCHQTTMAELRFLKGKIKSRCQSLLYFGHLCKFYSKLAVKLHGLMIL